ncbi:MAG: hypothetical protein H6707_10835 [Deltaproteobacteria bacterium]|nr:hypothetical protein [Deltaproteobacteria bacterium]
MSAHQRPSRRMWWRKQIKVHAHFAETLGLVGLLSALNMGLLPAQPGFFGIEPNPYWAVILLMAFRYGLRASLFAAAVCSTVYFALVYTHVGVVSPRDLLLWEYAKSPLLFLVVGILGGTLTQRHVDNLARSDERADALARQVDELQHGEAKLRDVNVELANRVLGANDTLPLLYKYAKKLNSVDVDHVLSAITELVQEVIKADDVCAYRLTGDGAELHSRNGQRAALGEFLDLDPRLHQLVVREGKVLTLQQLIDQGINQPNVFICGPLRASADNVIGLLMVRQLDFLRFNPAAVRLFNIVVDWSSDCLQRALVVERQPQQQRLQENRAALRRARRVLPTDAPHLQPRRAAPQVLADPGRVDKPSVSGLFPTTSGSIAQLLDETDQRLFEQHDPRDAPGLRDSAELVLTDADIDLPQQQSGELRDALTCELQIAKESGNEGLTRLLAEIDSFIGKGTSRD